MTWIYTWVCVGGWRSSNS